jgi:hypothetical protein
MRYLQMYVAGFRFLPYRLADIHHVVSRDPNSKAADKIAGHLDYKRESIRSPWMHCL